MAWSASNKCVTNSYKFALGTGQIKGINEQIEDILKRLEKVEDVGA